MVKLTANPMICKVLTGPRYRWLNFKASQTLSAFFFNRIEVNILPPKSNIQESDSILRAIVVYLHEVKGSFGIRCYG